MRSVSCRGERFVVTGVMRRLGRSCPGPATPDLVPLYPQTHQLDLGAGEGQQDRGHDAVSVRQRPGRRDMVIVRAGGDMTSFPSGRTNSVGSCLNKVLVIGEVVGDIMLPR